MIKLVSYHSSEEDHSYGTGDHDRISGLLRMARFGKLQLYRKVPTQSNAFKYDSNTANKARYTIR